MLKIKEAQVKYFFDNIVNRLGDEIQMTALLKWYKLRNLEFYYQDSLGLAKTLFPAGLVNFVMDNKTELPNLNLYNLWIFSPFLRAKGIYTEIRDKYDVANADLDIVMAPVIKPVYNFPREFNPQELFFIFDHWPNSRLVIDKDKAKYFSGFMQEKLILSESWEETFALIRRAKVFVGGDTGSSHYAGACQHPNMVLLYPDMKKTKKANEYMQKKMAKELNEPDFLKYSWDSTPCCEPKSMHLLELENNTFNQEELLSILTKLLSK